MIARAAAIALFASIVPRATALQAPCARSDAYCREVDRITRDARVRRAASFLDRTDAAAVRELIALTRIAAPPFKEAERARRYAELLREAGADSVAVDEAGNVIALRRGLSRKRTIAVSGHLDTVFPEGTSLNVEQRGDTLFAPGIADNTRGLIAVLQVMRAMIHARIRTSADLLFIGTVGEEGLGDLRGVKYLFRPGARRIDAMIVVDGASDETITNTAVGSRRYRVIFEGPGGHSWGAFGTANPIHALSRAIETFDDAAMRYIGADANTTYNVGRIGGGTSINSIAAQAWAEVDIRSRSAERLAAVDSIFHVSMVTALNEQNARRTIGPELSLEARPLGDRPSGSTPSGSPLVQRAVAVTRALGLTPRLDESSTDANYPISRGIPAITIGRGGVSGRSHSVDEWWLNENGTRGLKRLLYITLAEAGLS